MFKNIENFPNYRIYDDGRVFSYVSNRFLKPYKDPHGYYRVTLCKGGKRKDFPLHRLMLLVWKGLDVSKIYCNHIDGNKINNKLDNLEWATPVENAQHAQWMHLAPNGEKHYKCKLLDREVEVIRKLYCGGKYNQVEIAELFTVSQGLISLIIRNKTRKHNRTIC